MLTIYDRCYADTGQGDPQAIREALESAWQWARGHREAPARYVAEAARLMTLLPAPEDDSWPACWAVDTLIAVIQTVEGIGQRDGEKAIHVAEYMLNVATDQARGAWFHEHGKMPSDDETDTRPEMQQYLERVERDLSDLESAAADDLPALIDDLRRRAEAEPMFDYVAASSIPAPPDPD